MCNLRSRKRLLDSETVMEGPMGSLNGNITDATNCLFHHGQGGIPVSGSMFTPDYCPSTADSYDDLRELLMLARLELETTRNAVNAVNAQGKMHEARVWHLEELLKTVRRERDEAREQCLQLHGRLSRSPSRKSLLGDSLPNAVDAALKAHHQQQQQQLQQQKQLEELQQHLELHEHHLSPTHARLVRQDSHIEDPAQVHHHCSSPQARLVRQDSHMERLEDSSQVLQHLDIPSPEAHSSLHPLSQMHSPDDQINRLQEMQQAPSSPSLQQQAEHHLHQQQQQEEEHSLHQHHHLGHHGLIQQRTIEQLTHESEQLLSHMQQQSEQQQLQAEQQAALVHQQLMQESPSAISVNHHHESSSALSVKLQRRDSSAALSVMLHRDSPTAVSLMQHRDSPTGLSVMQHRESPTGISLQHRESPSAMSVMQHRESPSAMSAMQHPAWQAISGGNSPYASPGLCSPPLSSSLGLPSACLQSGSAVSSLLSPLERYESVGASGSILSSRPLHLPEPPEANLQVMLKTLPEKGKLLQAVMQAGPLLQTLLVAGPLPQWRHPPPALDTLDIPRVSMSSSTSCDLPQTGITNTGLIAGSALDQHSVMHLSVPIPSQESSLSHLSLPLTSMSTGGSTGFTSQGLVRVSSRGHLGADMRMMNPPLKYAKIH